MMLVLSIQGADLEKALPRVAAFTSVFDILEVRLGDRPLSTKDQAFLKALDVRLCYTVPPNYPFLTALWTPPPYLIDVPWQTPSDTLATIRSFSRWICWHFSFSL